MTDIERLLLLAPISLDFWDWDELSKNPNISFEFIKNNLYLPWNWNLLSNNYNITFEIILNNLEYPWDWNWLSWRNDLTLNIVKTNLDKNWNWYGISRINDITIDFIKSLPDKMWNWYSISKRVSLSEFENNKSLPWDPHGLSLNSNITPEIVEKYSHINWDHFNLSINNNFGLEWIIKNKDKKLYWRRISEKIDFKTYLEYKHVLSFNKNDLIYNENIPVKYFIENKDFFEDKLLRRIMINRKLTFDEVNFLKEFDKFGDLCGNKYLEWYILENLINKDWKLLSKNPNVSMDIIENKNYPWCYKNLSANINLTWQFVIKNINKNWNWQLMSCNRFNGQKNNYRYMYRIYQKDKRLNNDLIYLLKLY